jgi:Flp pilus assembly protein TadD
VAVAREYWERGNARVAAAEYGKAFALDGRNVDAVAGLAELAFADGRYKQAAQYYARASRLRPGSLRYLMNLGNAHLRAGQRSEAAAAFRQVLELSPGNPTAKRNLELAER